MAISLGKHKRFCETVASSQLNSIEGLGLSAEERKPASHELRASPEPSQSYKRARSNKKLSIAAQVRLENESIFSLRILYLPLMIILILSSSAEGSATLESTIQLTQKA